MGQRDRHNPTSDGEAAPPSPSRPSNTARAARTDATGTRDEIETIDTMDRPGASGHRFGPDLACSECGISWDLHQREPKPCRTVAPSDAFARRPSEDFEA